MISEQIADKFFPGENPLGKVLAMNDELDFTIEPAHKLKFSEV